MDHREPAGHSECPQGTDVDPGRLLQDFAWRANPAGNVVSVNYQAVLERLAVRPAVSGAVTAFRPNLYAMCGNSPVTGDSG